VFILNNRILTISRQFGSGGRTIGKEVASILGVPCYDQELIELFAKESGFSENMVAELDEHSAKRKLFSDRANQARQDVYLQRALWVAQEKAILKLAQQGPCVIVGRCAGHILQDANCLRTYIHAEESLRAKRIVEVYGETGEDPLQRIRDKDKRRKEYYQRYTGKKCGDAANFHIALDSGSLGIDTCVNILAHLF